MNVGQINQANSIRLAAASVPTWLEVGTKARREFMDQLQGRIQDQEGRVQQLKTRLQNKAYVENAPRKLVAETKAQLAEAEVLLKKFTADYERFTAKK